MKSTKFSMLVYSALFTAGLGLHQRVTADPELAQAEQPITRVFLAPAADHADDEQGAQVEHRRERRNEVRIERRGPDGRVQIEERFGTDGEEPEEGDVIERHTRPFNGPAEGPEVRHFFRKAPTGQGEGDVIIRRFPGERGLRAEPKEPRQPREPREPRPPRNRRDQFGGPGAGPEMEQRAEHIEQAIRHLREAGLNDVADRLDERLEQLRQRRREMEPAFGELREQMDHLRREQEQLRDELQKLKRALREDREKKPREEQ